jgi:hypothetical protein
MPRVGLEPTIPVFERAKTVHALDLVALAEEANRRDSGRCPSSATDRLADAVGLEMMKYVTTCSLSLGSFGQLHSSSLEADLSWALQHLFN